MTRVKIVRSEVLKTLHAAFPDFQSLKLLTNYLARYEFVAEANEKEVRAACEYWRSDGKLTAMDDPADASRKMYQITTDGIRMVERGDV